MAKILTRSELYELIWSQPRTALAKELGVSDVTIGKHCARAHIPAPPPGYWARKNFGKVVARPVLPIRLPGHTCEITLGESEQWRYWPGQEDLNAPLHAPTFPEQIEQQVAEALKKIGRVSACRDLSSPHQSLNRVLAAEALRRERHRRHDWSIDKPYFDETHHQRQLRIFNSIANALSLVTAKQEVFIHDEWVQGYGTLHFLKLRLNFGGSSLELEFIEPGDARELRRVKGFKGVTSTTIRVGTETSSLGVQDWTDQPSNRLERQLGEIIDALLYRAERGLRLHAHLEFERRVERRARLQKEVALLSKPRSSKGLKLLPHTAGKSIRR